MYQNVEIRIMYYTAIREDSSPNTEDLVLADIMSVTNVSVRNDG
jgi:hypothetical protein